MHCKLHKYDLPYNQHKTIMIQVLHSIIKNFPLHGWVIVKYKEQEWERYFSWPNSVTGQRINFVSDKTITERTHISLTLFKPASNWETQASMDILCIPLTYTVVCSEQWHTQGKSSQAHLVSDEILSSGLDLIFHSQQVSTNVWLIYIYDSAHHRALQFACLWRKQKNRNKTLLRILRIGRKYLPQVQIGCRNHRNLKRQLKQS